ncbi:hypothetical protein Hs30E_02250 [Lactococcus hodotermopsidis]|uniref:Uncharacterized protein n=1 Tax=Pseudolactococcus hodotermopsidis TaxID=2709157 RepID=A0A6A0BBC0_9LACT|nr:hypothetical protein [Lactococcus hodotermopsidis]GFH41674.1 hypothetical protein Hs30E_02250 [Lactococcus hodotermopsidis]
MFSGKTPTSIVITNIGLLIYATWTMINSILPNLKIFNFVYESILNVFQAFKLQSTISMTNVQFLAYIVLLVAFLALLVKFRHFAIYALLFFVFIIVCNFVYYVIVVGADSTEWFVFVVMFVSFVNVFITARGTESTKKEK